MCGVPLRRTIIRKTAQNSSDNFSSHPPDIIAHVMSTGVWAEEDKVYFFLVDTVWTSSWRLQWSNVDQFLKDSNTSTYRNRTLNRVYIIVELTPHMLSDSRVIVCIFGVWEFQTNSKRKRTVCQLLSWFFLECNAVQSVLRCNFFNIHLAENLISCGRMLR